MSQFSKSKTLFDISAGNSPNNTLTVQYDWKQSHNDLLFYLFFSL